MKTSDFLRAASLLFVSWAGYCDAATPLSFGTTYSGALTLPGQSHSFTFTGAAGQLLYLDTQDNDGVNIAATLSSPEGVALYSGNDDYDYGPFVLKESGTYSINIDGGAATTGDYRFRVLDLSAGSPMTLGVPLSKQLSPPMACNVYRFNGTRGQRINLQTLAYSSSQADWKLVSPAGSTLAAGPIYQNLGTITLPLNGDYYLLISGTTPGVAPLQFQVLLTDLSEGSVPASGFGVVQSGTVNANQTNSFTYAAPAGLPVFFDSQDTSGQSLVVDLIDPSGTTVFTIGETLDAGPYFLPRSGTYTLNVRGPGGASGNFRFRLADLTASPVMPLNSVVSNVLSSPYQTEVLQFSGAAGQRLYYDAIDSDFDNVYLWARSPDGQSPLSVNSDNDRGPFTLPTTGTYYVFIQSGLPSSANYVFEMFDIADQPVLPLNSDVTGTMPANGSTLFRLAGTSGQRLFFNGKWTSAGGGYWILYGPNDIPVNQANLNGDFEATLANSGNYTLVVSAGGTDLSYTNQVNTFGYSSNALTLGAVVTNTVVNPGDQLLYTFTGTTGQRLYYDSLNASYIPIYATLVSPHGVGLFSVNASSDRGPLTLTESGVYTLVFDGIGDTTGGISFQLLDVGTQPVLPLNSDFTGSLAANASSIYRLAGTNGQRLFFNGEWVSAGGGHYWTLYGPNDLFVGQAGLSGDFELTLGNSGSYALVLSAGSSDVSYTNQVNTFVYGASALTLGAIVTNTVAKPGDQLLYTFTGTAGQRLYYDALNANYISLSVTLVSPHGVGLFSLNASSDRGPLTLTESGLYTLVFDGNGDTTGGISFQLLDVNTQPALPLNTDLTGNLAANASAIYRFTGTGGQRLFFNGKGTSAGGGYWALYGPNELLVGQAPLNGDFEVTLANNGSYVLALSGGSSDVSYTNQVNTFNYASNTLTLGTAVTNIVVKPGDQILYTFTGTTGQRLYYDALNSSYISVSVTLVSPHGAALFSMNASTDRGPLTLTESGTYTLVFDGNGDTTGGVSFQLLDLAAAPSVTVGSAINSSLNDPSETKIHRFTATQGQRINLQSVSASSSQAFWELIGPADQVLGTAQNIVNNIGILTMPVSGSYVVLVSGTGNGSGSLNYQLSPTDVSDGPVAASGFGVIHGGNISANQTNSFTYDAPAGLPIFYDNQDASGQSLVVDLIDPFGNLITTWSETSDAGPFVLPRSGTYSLNVRGPGGSSGNFNFRLLDLSASQTLAPNATASNALSNPYQTDVYRFNSTAGQRLFYDAVIADPNYPSANIGLIDPRGLQISPGGAFANDYGPFTSQYSGVNYLFVRNNRNVASPTAFRLLDLAAQPALALNASITNAMESYPIAFFQYAGTAGQRLYFRGNGNNPSGYWSLYDPNNASVAGGYASLYGDFEVTLPYDGIYALVLSTYNGNSGPEIFQVNDYAYVTNSYAIDAVVNDTISVPGEQKFYSFTGTLGQRLVYDAVTNDPNYPLAYATLINPQGQHVEGPSGAFVNDYGPFTLQQSGRYTLVLDGASAHTGPIAFRLLDLATQPVLPTNTGVTNVIQNYPALVYQYAGTAGQRLYFHGNGNNQSGYWALYDPNNNIVSGANSGLSGDFEVTLPYTGTYALTLSTYNGNSGTEIFQVNDFVYVTNSYTVGTVVTDSLNIPGDQKYYTFAGTLGQRFVYDALTNDPNYPLLYVSLLNPQGAVETLSGAFASDYAPFTLKQSGTYTLVIDGSLSRTGPFAFRLLDLATQPVLPLNVSVTNAMQSYPALVFQYTGVAGQHLYFRGNGNNPGGYWTFYDPNNAAVSGGNSGLYGDFEVTLPYDGTYALLLSTYNANSGTEIFQVNPFNGGEASSINRAPMLSAIGDQTTGEGEILTFTAIATDADGDALNFSLDPNAPAGATIGATSGLFNWTPPLTGFSYVTNLTVRVTDNATPPLSVAETIAIRIIAGPVLIRVAKGSTNATVFWRSAPGEQYRLQYRNNLTGASWTDLSGSNFTATNFVSSQIDNGIGTNRERYYRIRFFPPP